MAGECLDVYSVTTVGVVAQERERDQETDGVLLRNGAKGTSGSGSPAELVLHATVSLPAASMSSII